MEKRYQVFISSTFTDLKDERQTVLKAVLELNHMPAGMELFPAADDSAWQLIKDVIDSSDYYVLIVGGRYGSLDDAGLSYTEKEYEYAITTHKPVIALLHANPESLPRDKTEPSEGAWERLKAFRSKVEKHHTCAFWNNCDELKARVIVGLTSAVKRHPVVGWVRADQVPTDATVSEVLALRKKVADLESQAVENQMRPPEGTEGLAQGEDNFDISFDCVAASRRGHKEQCFTSNLTVTWNEIFAAVAPTMISEADDYEVRRALKKFLTQSAWESRVIQELLKDNEISSPTLPDSVFDTCLVQFRALRLIQESDRKRSLKDTGKYWRLTPRGDYLMTKLRAIPKNEGAENASRR